MGSGECREKSTLCWKCANACGGCDWSREFKPVDGWEATPTKVYQNVNQYIDSYIVNKCPEFYEEKLNSIFRVSGCYVAEKLGCSRNTIYSFSSEELIAMCRNKGIKLEITRVGNQRRFWVDNSGRKTLTLPTEFIKLFFGKQKGYTGF